MTAQRVSFAFSSLLLATALATGATAQPVQKEVAQTAMTGEVKAVNTKAGTIRVVGANGEKGVFHVVAGKTTIMSGNQEVALTAIAKGARVAIDADVKGGKGGKGGRMTATYIEIVEAAPGGDATSAALPTQVGAKIDVRHNKLSPQLVEIAAGHSVTFHNVDKMPGGHTIVSADGAFSSPPLDEGQDWSHSFDVPGTYKVKIKEHPAAEATIVVGAAE